MARPMKAPAPHTGAPGAFTLIELLMVIAIIALLASLTMPAIDGVKKHADSIACMGNLRGIGGAVNLYVQDHDNTYPEVEPDPAHPIYPPAAGAKGMLETFAPYGVTEKVLRCPADVKDPNANYFAKRGTSYEWRPMLDDEKTTNATILRWRGATVVSPSRIRQVIDTMPVHNGRQNALYGDGRVQWY